jgi:general secretion pathway protein J
MRKTHIRDQEYRGSAPKGFTLLEVLVSIALITLIVAIVGASMRMGYRSIEKGENKATALERFKVSLSLMDAQIQSAMPLKTTDDEINRYLFEGKKDSLKFASNYSLMGGQRGYALVAYNVQTDVDNKHALFIQENTVGMENQKEIKLLEGLDDIHFEYFFKEPTAEEGQWVEEWTDTTAMPEKVRIHLAWGNKQISLIVPMRTRPMTAQSGFDSFAALQQRGRFS